MRIVMMTSLLLHARDETQGLNLSSLLVVMKVTLMMTMTMIMKIMMMTLMTLIKTMTMTMMGMIWLNVLQQIIQDMNILIALPIQYLFPNKFCKKRLFCYFYFITYIKHFNLRILAQLHPIFGLLSYHTVFFSMYYITLNNILFFKYHT